MLSVVFKTVLFTLLSLNVFAVDYQPFFDNECLDKDFSVDINHRYGLFSLLEKNLNVNKEKCSIKVTLSYLYMFKKYWHVDVCRGPVHLKRGKDFGSIEKIPVACVPDAEGVLPTFCRSKDDLQVALQDQGLLHADGEKENLESDHGKIYCSYLLVKKYLNEQLVFNRHKKYSGEIVPTPDYKLKKNEIVPAENKKLETEEVEKENKEESENLKNSIPLVREV